jgi:hypothetical protein
VASYAEASKSPRTFNERAQKLLLKVTGEPDLLARRGPPSSGRRLEPYVER